MYLNKIFWGRDLPEKKGQQKLGQQKLGHQSTDNQTKKKINHHEHWQLYQRGPRGSAGAHGGKRMGFGTVLGKALCLPLKVAGAIRRFLSSQMKYQCFACVQLTHFFSFQDWMDWASCTAYWKSESLLSDFLKMHPFSSAEIQFIVHMIFKWSVGIPLTQHNLASLLGGWNQALQDVFNTIAEHQSHPDYYQQKLWINGKPAIMFG